MRPPSPLHSQAVHAEHGVLRVKRDRLALNLNNANERRPMIWILFLGTMALSLWAAWRVESPYGCCDQGLIRSGLGRERQDVT